jgi:hypothetical protein
MRAKLLLIKQPAEPNEQPDSFDQIDWAKPPYNEKWLQNLIHACPELIPAQEIEPCFSNLIPVLEEFHLPDGNQNNYLDNFYITPDGYPVLAEVKLWKNQEARREVVVQIMNYAKEFSALKYESINKEIRRQNKTKAWGKNPLFEIAKGKDPSVPDEKIFVDNVCRNLREGRFLLLIVGDGVREEMASLAEYLIHHNLRYAFGIVEIQLFKMPDSSVLALPRVVTKTQTIERHVTVVSTQVEGLSVMATTPVKKDEKTSLSTDAFYSLMAENDPHNVIWFKDLLSRLADLSLDVQPGARSESVMLKAPLPDGDLLNLMLVTPTAAQFWGVYHKQRQDPVWQSLAQSYMEKITALVPGSSIKLYPTGADIKLDGKPLPIKALQGKTEALAQAIREVLREAESYYEQRETSQAA